MADIDTANADTLLEMGPIDYIVLEWPGRQPDGSVAPLILDLVDRGLIRILDVAFLGKDEDGSAYAVDIADIDAAEAFGVFDGASSGLLRRGGPRGGRVGARARHHGGRARVGEPLGGPVAVAIRKSGGQLVASGRIPVQAIIASLDALEAAD